jgi:CRISPR-associated protein Csm5
VRYRLTCLTPLLVGDGNHLSPIDYMVWREQVNVLDQRRIFKLLARGPRLEGYLSQLRAANKLDFAAWGGFAQNFAGRRIPFEDPSLTEIWNRAQSQHLFIPTFVSSLDGLYLPGSAIKGALRTPLLFEKWRTGIPERVAGRLRDPAGVRQRPGWAEVDDLGTPTHSRLRFFAIGDSASASREAARIYLTRVATLQSAGKGAWTLAWKAAPRGSVPPARVDDSVPTFAEMTAPGSVFEGVWREHEDLNREPIRRALGWPSEMSRASLFAAANEYAARLIALQRRHASACGLAALEASLESLESRLAEIRAAGGCLLNLGWGGGLLGKAAWIGAEEEPVRKLLAQVPVYSRTLESGYPFPKTRRIVFEKGQPATLPGWASLEVSN